MKSLVTRFLDFARENKIWVLSVAALLLGAIPLYIYALSVGELPDFSLAELTGTLIASFLTEVFIGSATVGYLLFAGLAARHAVNAFYPEVSGGIPGNRHYLMRGNFIQGVTAFSILTWFGLATSSFDIWLAPGASNLTRGAYVVSLCSAALLVAFDWRNGRRPLKYVLLTALASSATFLCVLLIAYLNGYVVVPPGPARPEPRPSVPLLELNRRLTDVCAWLLHDHLIATASAAAIAVCILLPVVVRKTRGRRHANKSGAAAQPFFTNETLKLLAAKAWVTAVFWFLLFLTAYFLSLFVSASPAHSQTATALMGGLFLILFNWWAFVAKDWKQRIFLGATTFCFIFIMLPLQTNNATLLPKMVVNALGFGNRHAANVVLASTECPALARYGVSCKAEKDASIGITNANILDRLGSTVLIELQVKRTAAPSSANNGPRAEGSAPVAQAPTASRVAFIPLTIATPKTGTSESKDFVRLYACDPLLMERLRAVDPAKAGALACVKLSVAKDHLIGHTVNGPATYSGEFSQYVQVGG
jgi:hypothetical protein